MASWPCSLNRLWAAGWREKWKFPLRHRIFFQLFVSKVGAPVRPLWLYSFTCTLLIMICSFVSCVVSCSVWLESPHVDKSSFVNWIGFIKHFDGLYRHVEHLPTHTQQMYVILLVLFNYNGRHLSSLRQRLWTYHIQLYKCFYLIKKCKLKKNKHHMCLKSVTFQRVMVQQL